MAGIKEVAEKAGVSIATVSNVINNSKPVSPKLREKVEKAIQELEYFVHPFASGLKSQRTNNIGVILPYITSIYFPPVLDGIENAAKQYGYHLIYFNSNHDIRLEQEYIGLLKNYRIDGLIIDSCCAVSEESSYAQFLVSEKPRTRQIPVISLERSMDPEAVNSVIIDNFYYSYKVTKYLIEAKHKKIVHITGPLKLSMGLEILAGYQKALMDHHLKVDERLLREGDYTPLGGYNRMKEIINVGTDFTAVFAANDQSAIGAVKAIKEAGLRIPEDVAVFGFDNVFAGTLIEPPLSTVHVPRYRLGYEAVSLMVKHIENPDSKPDSIQLECNLIIRQSTDRGGERGWDLIGW